MVRSTKQDGFEQAREFDRTHPGYWEWTEGQCLEPGCEKAAERGPYTGYLEYCRKHWGIADRTQARSEKRGYKLSQP